MRFSLQSLLLATATCSVSNCLGLWFLSFFRLAVAPCRRSLEQMVLNPDMSVSLGWIRITVECYQFAFNFKNEESCKAMENPSRLMWQNVKWSVEGDTSWKINRQSPSTASSIPDSTTGKAGFVVYLLPDPGIEMPSHKWWSWEQSMATWLVRLWKSIEQLQ